MTPELARAAIEFLKRTELRGVECFVMHALLRELERDASAVRPNGSARAENIEVDDDEYWAKRCAGAAP